MNITKKSSTCKSASTKLLNPVDIGSGNIIPNWWHSKILTTGGKADTMAIALLSELWFLYRSTRQEEPQIFEGIWSKIRQGLIDYYGLGGNAMDSAWFAKLKADIDLDAKKLTLKAPPKFIKDCVQSNYSHLIDKLCRLHGYSLDEVLAV